MTTAPEFVARSDSLAYRTIGIYVFLRTVMCSPVRGSQIAHALKLPRVSVLRRLEKLIKHGNVERVGNAYRVTDKVSTLYGTEIVQTVPDLTEAEKQLHHANEQLAFAGAYPGRDRGAATREGH